MFSERRHSSLLKTTGNILRNSSQHAADFLSSEAILGASERLESPMGHKRARAVAVGLSAAAGAFVVATMISAASAPTARADDSSEILANIQADEAAAAADFSTASADFAKGSADIPAGLTALFEGVDDDTFGVAYNLDTGTLDSLYNVPVAPASTFEFTFATPANFNAAITEATTIQTTGNTDMTTAATDFAAGDYTDGEVANDLGSINFLVIPEQVQFIGEVEQLMALFPGT
jgi:hypothetical protein